MMEASIWHIDADGNHQAVPKGMTHQVPTLAVGTGEGSLQDVQVYPLVLRNGGVEAEATINPHLQHGGGLPAKQPGPSAPV